MSGDGAADSGYIRLIRRLLVTFALASLALPVTEAVAQPNAAQQALDRRLGPQAVVDVDASTGTPRVLARLDGTLTGAVSGAPEDVAMRYVRRNLDVLGLTESDLDTLSAPETSTANGVTEVRWRQVVAGIPAADSELRLNVTRDGRILNVLGAPVSGLDLDTTPALTPGEAVREVQEDVGIYRALPRDSGPAGAIQATEYADGSEAKLTLFHGGLAWRVLYYASSREVFDAFVDAETGRVLQAHNMVKEAAPARVWERYPGAPLGGTQQAVDLETLGYLTAGANVLSGPFVRAWSDLNDDNDNPSVGVDAGEDISRTGGSFDFTFTPRTTGTGCSASFPCSWNSTVANSWQANRNQNGVQAFYLANRFRDHLAASPINFAGFSGVDRVSLHTEDGASSGPDGDHRNNANMLTLPEGTPPVMQMYLWGRSEAGNDTGLRDVNSGDDASILFHEYTHGLSNRLVIDAGGFGALNAPQAGAMGEGWGDWYAKDFLVGAGFSVDTNAAGELDMGEYTDVVAHLVRNQPIDCPVGASSVQCPAAGTAGSGGFTYGDFGKVNGGPEVHGDGEIWAQTLWDLRRSIGSTAARQLITEGMRQSPDEPSFLDMRNAILQADVALGTGLRNQIWTVFAARGMGFFASTINGNDTSPRQDFSLPPAAGGPRGRIDGRVTDIGTGAAITGSRAAIGGLENGPEALAAVPAANGTFTINNVPARSYPTFLFKAPGYDTLVRAITVPSGGSTNLVARLRRNWSSLAGGATATGDQPYLNFGCGVAAAIDQSPATGWSNDDVGTPTMTITLPQAVPVTRFGIDNTAACGSDDGSATNGITIQTSPTDGGAFTTLGSANLQFNDSHEIRELTTPAGPVVAKRVRVMLTSNHGGGFRDLSEFAVYTTAAGDMTETVTPGPTPTPTPTPTATATATATATPVPTVFPTVQPTPVPTVIPTPTPVPKATLRLDASGKRAVKLRVTCPARCSLDAKLTVDAATAKKLGLRGSRTVGTVRRTLAAGSSTSITVSLTSRAKQRLTKSKLKSFKATLTAKAGGVEARRRVTVKK